MDQDVLNEREWAQPHNWSRWGTYRSPRDTRIWVRKRDPRFGWTVNTAHRAGRLWLLALLLIPLALLLITVMMTRLSE